ncbi:MAG: helix-turn-helix transcriptional regulator [Bacteroidetes bacterium]|nr:helix-turn-helix transcriptional regulator [Bacteroidota bacterium]MCL5737793.1 helix-turn-helix transcriptional regulator [Bacteroidota bacterium]
MDDELSQRIAALSGREREIFRMIGRGLSSKEIAVSLCISKRTVDHHREKMLRKLNLSGFAQLIALAAYFVSSLPE